MGTLCLPLVVCVTFPAHYCRPLVTPPVFAGGALSLRKRCRLTFIHFAIRRSAPEEQSCYWSFLSASDNLRVFILLSSSDGR
jgi:hypothetical protein